jgi:hypothetical protein
VIFVVLECCAASVVVYGRVETTYRSHLQGPSSLLGRLGPWWWDRCPETSVTSYQPTPGNIPEQRRPSKSLLSKAGELHGVFVGCNFPMRISIESSMLFVAHYLVDMTNFYVICSYNFSSSHLFRLVILKFTEEQVLAAYSNPTILWHFDACKPPLWHKSYRLVCCLVQRSHWTLLLLGRRRTSHHSHIATLTQRRSMNF